MKTKEIDTLKSSKKTTETNDKTFKTTKASILLGARSVREGKKVSLESLMKKIDETSKQRLETLESKFGITWKPTAFEHTLSPQNEVKYKLDNAFIVVGEKEGKTIFFDRFQYMLFINGHRQKAFSVLSMTKNKFEKMVAAL